MQDKVREIIKEDPDRYYEDYLQLRRQVENSSARYQGKPVNFIYTPFLLTESDLEIFEDICARLISILNKVIDKYLDDPGFRKYFSFPPLMEKLILKDPGYSNRFPMARFDLFYPEDGYIQFCEFNTDGSSGMNEERVLQKLFKESDIMSAFADYDIYTREFFISWVDSVIDNYLEYNDGIDNNPAVAIVDFKGEGVESEFREFQKTFINRGYDTVICDPAELKYRNNKLYYDDQVIDLIYRRVTTGRLVERAEDARDLIDAYLHGDVCIVGGFISQIIHNKVLFAILYDEQKVDFLTKNDHEFIKKHIPYTSILNQVQEGTIDNIIRDKDRYVLKPFDKFACKGVYVGKDYERKKWAEIVDDVLDDNYLLQEYCNVPVKEMPTAGENNFYFEEYNYIIGLYLYNQELAGFYVRTGRENIIGSLVECFTAPVFTVDKKYCNSSGPPGAGRI